MKARYILKSDGKGKWGVWDRDQAKFTGKLTDNRSHAMSRLLTRNASKRKTVKRRQLDPLLMGNGEGKACIVIDNDRVMEYVGIGWVDLRKATNSDRARYPEVED